MQVTGIGVIVAMIAMVLMLNSMVGNGDDAFPRIFDIVPEPILQKIRCFRERGRDTGGTCHKETTRYYFDHQHNVCLSFKACGKQVQQGNNFETHAECSRTCQQSITHIEPSRLIYNKSQIIKNKKDPVKESLMEPEDDMMFLGNLIKDVKDKASAMTYYLSKVNSMKEKLAATCATYRGRCMQCQLKLNQNGVDHEWDCSFFFEPRCIHKEVRCIKKQEDVCVRMRDDCNHCHRSCKQNECSEWGCTRKACAAEDRQDKSCIKRVKVATLD